MPESRIASLYDPAFEHDSCGFGLVAQVDGRASTDLVDAAFTALARLSHRGGVNADGISGDGCGVLIRRPTAWLRALAAESGLHPAACFAAGLVFLDPEDGRGASVLETQLAEAGLRVAGWREVAID
ncbi:MAG: hypothetical protein HOQ10_06955, partial [Frateuria sp.]|nr:hypothetical protein [Frateuria sp.]